MNPSVTRQRVRLTSGTELSVLTSGDPAKPAVLLLHGLQNSARMFRHAMPRLAQVAFAIAPDLPGFGESDLLPTTSFDAYAQGITELVDRLAVGPRYVYLHDYGAPVGLRIAMEAPELVLGLIVQNANAHRTGMGPQWAPTEAFWANPTPENEAATTGHLTFEGTREQYLKGVPPDITATIPSALWEEDWRVSAAAHGGARPRRRAPAARDALGAGGGTDGAFHRAHAACVILTYRPAAAASRPTRAARGWCG